MTRLALPRCTTRESGSIDRADALLDAVTGMLGLCAVALTTYTPSRDVEGATHASVLHILGRIADHHAARR